MVAGRHHATATMSLSSSSAQNWSLWHQSCSPGLELLLHLDAASTFSSRFLIGTLSLCLPAPARALPDKWAGEWEQTNDGTTRVAPDRPNWGHAFCLPGPNGRNYHDFGQDHCPLYDRDPNNDDEDLDL